MRAGLHTVVRAVVAVVVAGVTVTLLAAGTGAGAADRTPARSVLVISLPATAWIDIRDGHAPNLEHLFRTSALADVSTRTVRNRTTPGPAYTAFGAGARSVAPPDDAALNLEPAERYAGQRAAEVFATRTGRPLARGIGALGFAQLEAQNRKQSYSAEVGALGRALRTSGIDRTVIANADETTPVGVAYHREAALALLGRTGQVPGAVAGLLRPDPRAPYGVRLDDAAVVRAFPRDFDTRRQVVLVEASDLARADTIRPETLPVQRDALHAAALARTDRLVGRLLERVDLSRDAVLVVSPYHTGRARTLTVAAVHAPGVDPGLAETATTRRAGFVQIVDLAPTVLDLLGLPRPDAMEGRAATYHTDGRSYVDRVDWLVRADRASQFRDDTIGKATATLVATTIGLAVAAWLWYVTGRRADAGLLLQWASLLVLAYVAATFLAGALPIFRWGTGAYFLVVVALSVSIAGLAFGIGRGRLADPVIAVLGVVVALHIADLLSGARLELNTVFGYTATVGIRIAGIGNPGSAELSASALLLAILLTWRFPRRGGATGDTMLVIVLLVVGAPFWGQDFGGALALAPTVALWWLLRRDRRIRWRTVLAGTAILIGAGLVVGLVDLARPADSRTHVGRFFERVGSDGVGGLLSVIGRKASLMIGTFSNTAWVLLVVSALGLLWLAARRTSLLEAVVAAVPTLRPGLACFAMLVVLATALNDSGVQVAGMMLATLLPTLVFLATRVTRPGARPLALPDDDVEPVPA